VRLGLWLCVLACLSSRAVHAQDDAVSSCLADHTQGQELRRDGKLLESQEVFKRCSFTQCPSEIIRDCLDWMDQVQKQIPSVGFRVTADGVNRADVRVLIDETLVLSQLTGKAIDLNPGLHRVQVLLAPFAPFNAELVVNEGDKFRIVDVAFGAAAPRQAKPIVAAAPSQPVEMARPIPTMSYVFAGLSVAAAASGTAWGLATRSRRAELDQDCAPACSPDRVDTVKQRALFTDISWGVSALSFIGAATFYIFRPEEPLSDAVEVGLSWLPGGGLGSVSVAAF
jgi:hypothetical protein